MILRILASAFALLTAATTPTSAVAQTESFDSYVEELKAKALAEGVSQSTVTRMTIGLEPNMRVIRLDRAQPGTPTRSGYPPLAPYIARHVDSERISGGRRQYINARNTIRAVEAEYGVPGEILVAIWGHETAYGSVKGGFDLAQALATLAWEGRRRDLFEREFIALMKVADRGYTRSQLKGSWAGAFGNPQFLPSVYLRLATDGDGDGRADIMNNRADTLASIAAYFRDSGWRTGQPWGVGVSLPSGFDIDRYKTKLRAQVCPRVHERHSVYKTVAEWRELGVRPFRSLPDDMLVSLFQPDGPGTRSWMLTTNYRVILEYNCSNYYAMSVGLLADEIAR